MSVPQPRAFYLADGPRSMLATFHDSAVPRPASAVLFSPPFGNIDICSYRARRAWSQQLAQDGHPALRIELPGTGNSGGGPRDPARLAAWVDGVSSAAGWLRETTGCERVVAVGIGLGGLVAYRAAAEGADITDLALWATPSRGRTLVRELRALSGLEATASDTEQAGGQSLPDGFMASAGYVLSAETIAELEALDLTELTLPGGARRRILLLERDGIPVEARLRDALDAAGVTLTVAAGDGYGAMVSDPQRAQAPIEVFARLSDWLSQGDRAGADAPRHATGETASMSEHLDLLIEGVAVRETPRTFERPFGRLFGVLAAPRDADAPAEVCAVLLNAGAQRHVGPNRMWVEMARRWAVRGIPTLRLDLGGIGEADSDGTELVQDAGFYTLEFVDQVRAVLDDLVEAGLPARFVLAGLCSGAYWSLHAALEDPRVAAAFLLNPKALFWDRRLDGVRDARNLRKVGNPATWAKLVRGDITPERIRTIGSGVRLAIGGVPARLTERRQRRMGIQDDLADALDHVRASGQRVLVVFTSQEPLLEELEADGRLERLRRAANVRVEVVPIPLASHTLEPIPLQCAVHRLLDDALEQMMSVR